MTVTVQEAEVIFSEKGIGKVASASSRARQMMDKLAAGAGLADRAITRVGSVGVRGLKSVASAAGKAAAGMGALSSRAAKTGATLGVTGAVAAGGAMIKLAADAEQLNTQFRVLTGSQEAATKLLNDIDQFAASTPFQKMEIAQAGRQLLAFGGSADTAVDELRMLGDIAAGTGQPLGELAELYGKAKVQGRLFGEDINQLTGRGIPIIQGLAKEFGVTDGEVKKLVEQGKVGFPEMQRALAAMTGDGGKFSGMMQQMSETTAGKFSTLKDNVTLLATNLGGELLPVANELIDWAMSMAGSTDGLGESFAGFIQSARSGWDELSGTLQDYGVIAGVVIGNLDTLWSGLFQDIPSYAKAAFAWLEDNSGRIISNIGTMVSNMYAKINQAGAQLGDEIAYQLGLSDEVLNLGAASQKPLQALSEFQGPELSDETTSVLRDIQTELDQSRQQRSASQSETPETTAAVTSAATQAFVSQQQTADVAGQQAAAKAATNVERGSAMDVFKRVQDALTGDQLKVQQEQLKVQQQLLTAAQQTASGLSSLGGAFAPVLG